MSAHLKFGTIHPRTMVADLDLRGIGAQTYLRELAFRDFYADVLHNWPASAWRNWNADFDAIETDSGAEAKRRFEAWKAGETGFPLVDAGMRQLRETGFMHNRVRMIVASFLVKDLHLPWQWGAEWFLDQLVDGDMASNQHGWQWCAGCGTDAAPYFRVFNPRLVGQILLDSSVLLRSDGLREIGWHGVIGGAVEFQRDERLALSEQQHGDRLGLIRRRPRNHLSPAAHRERLRTSTDYRAADRRQ